MWKLVFGGGSQSVLQYYVLPLHDSWALSGFAAQAPWSVDGSPLPLAWPSTGTIRIEDYGLQYRKGLDWALEGISLDIQEREKVRDGSVTGWI